MIYEFDLVSYGVGTPWAHSSLYPSRESAGRNGMLFMRDEIRKVAEQWQSEGSTQYAKFAFAMAEAVTLEVHGPAQLEFGF